MYSHDNSFYNKHAKDSTSSARCTVSRGSLLSETTFDSRQEAVTRSFSLPKYRNEDKWYKNPVNGRFHKMNHSSDLQRLATLH